MAEDSLLYLVANKADKDVTAEVKYEDGVKFAKTHNFDYFCETSAKSGKGIKDLFLRIGKQLYTKFKDSDKSNIVNANKMSIISGSSTILLRDATDTHTRYIEKEQTGTVKIRKAKRKKEKK
mmetsp:Transcript_34783/g.40269  ORF Transcript_34783/g.40269 Transcript_34783/m.40269 type:complete len:122 (+) Transcript_34783:387-752(+)